MNERAFVSSKVPTSRSWLDYAEREYGEDFVDEIRALVRIVVVFLPTPLFWTIYDQQGSRWTLQAQQMKMFDMVLSFNWSEYA